MPRHIVHPSSRLTSTRAGTGGDGQLAQAQAAVVGRHQPMAVDAEAVAESRATVTSRVSSAFRNTPPLRTTPSRPRRPTEAAADRGDDLDQRRVEPPGDAAPGRRPRPASAATARIRGRVSTIRGASSTRHYPANRARRDRCRPPEPRRQGHSSSIAACPSIADAVADAGQGRHGVEEPARAGGPGRVEAVVRASSATSLQFAGRDACPQRGRSGPTRPGRWASAMRHGSRIACSPPGMPT